jgi:signal transduction histidine kinase
LTLEDEAPGALIEGDQDQLYQVSLNLILNAIDAMVEGGAMIIRLFGSGNQLMIAFRDTGPGVPAELQERVFNPFFTTKPNGTGLGLAKAYTILEGHHGRIECSSPPGGGATFMLVLPLIAVRGK